jgi:arginase
MPAKFVVVPQWQGSSSSRAMRLIDGAEAIRGDLPTSATRAVEVPLGAGDGAGTGVHRYSTLAVVRERTALVLDDLAPDDVPVLIGGDCGVELAGVARAVGRARAAGKRLGLVWFDAHPDLHTVATSESGAFAGMVLRALLGEGVDGLTVTEGLDPADVLLVGTRSMEDAEEAVLRERGLRLLAPDASADQVAEAVDGWDEVYVHVDLDVLDPGDFEGLLDPQPFGMAPAAVSAAITTALAGRRLAGAGLAMFAPASPDAAARDLPTILRILSAMTASTRPPRAVQTPSDTEDAPPA